MPDIIVEDAVLASLHASVQPRSLVWVNSGTGYAFGISVGQNTLSYYKTSDGGSTWAGGSVYSKAASQQKIGVWYDGWTRGITGSIIHLCFIDPVTDDILYGTFNTNGDVIGGSQVVFDGATADITTDWNNHCLSITKSRGGSIYVGGWMDNDGENGFWSSSNGSSWTSLLTVADGNAVDRIQFLPASGTNANDCWCIYRDVSTSGTKLYIYDSAGNYGVAGSWITGTSITTGSSTETSFFPFDSVSRHSDDHILLATWDKTSQLGAGSILFFDITGSNNVTQKTRVFSSTSVFTNVGMMINQQTNDIYVGYNSDGNLGSIVYKTSSDGGDTWGAETKFSETSDDYRLTMGGTSVGNDGGRFQIVWYNDDFDELVTNRVNSIEIGASGAVTTVWYIYQYNNPFVNITYPVLT